jgi:hypothetical protein
VTCGAPGSRPASRAARIRGAQARAVRGQPLGPAGRSVAREVDGQMDVRVDEAGEGER